MRKKVDVGQKILKTNEEFAQRNLEYFEGSGKVCLNLISSPGSGKTTILTKTILDLQDKMKIGVIEGDVETEFDAQRIRETKAAAVQIETEGACHLSAAQVAGVLDKLGADELELIIIENVGNLVCPSAFKLGETGKVVVLSVAEGDDKPAKYPAIFARAKAMLINKVDMLKAGVVEFDVERVKRDARKLNKDIAIFEVSAKTGEGMDGWYEWLLNLRNKSKK